MISTRFKGRSEYTKNILTLITGTGVAQLIPVAVSPIITRLYSPEDFGLIALYQSLVAIISVFHLLFPKHKHN
jgi:O-antigen/teichoic acid export membrane protein